MMINNSGRVVAALVIVIASALGLAASASANEYDVWSCLGPSGETLSADAWNATTNDAMPGDVSMTDDCATGGPVGLHVNDAGVPGGRRARIDLTFDLPRGASISGYRLNRSIRTSAAYLGYNYGAAVRESVPGSNFDEGCASFLMPPYFNCSNWGSYNNPADPNNIVDRPGLSLSGLGTWAACLSAGCSPPAGPKAAELNLFQSVVSVVDNASPTLVRVGGSLARPVPVSGVADLFVEASDANAGVRSFALSIDGTPAQTITNSDYSSCNEPFEVPRPCPAQTGRNFSVDTAPLAPGSHVADGTITDAAGNSTPFGPVSFTVAAPEPEPDPGNGTPAVADPQLKLDRTMIQRQAGKPARVTGTLTTAAGVPVSGASLKVQASTMAGGSSIESPMASVSTDSAGEFAVTTRARGARRITVSYSPIVGGEVTRSASAIVRSRISMRFRATPRKIQINRKVRFDGRVMGGGSTVRGANVEIQAIVDGRWQTVTNVSARSGGKFMWTYRFRHVERNALFSFRAIVRATPGWPWPTTKSKKMKVQIRVPSR